MSAQATHRLAIVLCLAACSANGLASAADAAQNAVSKLRQTGEVACQPSLPFFCGNLHVSCSGKTAIETFAFKLRATSAQGAAQAAAQGAVDSAFAPALLRQPFENLQLDWDAAGKHVIFHSRPANSGYVKLNADGSYQFRFYPNGEAVMSQGRCQ